MSKTKITVDEIWQVYREAVGGKDYKGNPLPDTLSELATSARSGWTAVVNYINELIDKEAQQ